MLRIAIATGGTGGHIYPALALADAAKQKYKECEIIFIGNDNRMETTLVPQAGYAFKGLHTSGLTGSLFNKAKAVTQMLKAKKDAKKILLAFQPDIVIGFGGYVSAPVILAACKCGFKTIFHEQNSIVGKANLLLAKKVDGIVVCYDKCFSQLPKEKTRLLGNPRASLAAQKGFDQSYLESFHLPKYKPVVLVVMGSLGSTSINKMMSEVLQEITDVSFLYVTGKGNYEKVKEAMPYSHVLVKEYVDQMALLKGIDLIVCRAGATTAAEITALGVPSILIPSPYVANNHQFYNANVLVEHKCAFMIEEKDLNKESLYDKINMVIHQPKLMKEMKQNALAIGYPNASRDILLYIDEIVR